MDQITQPGHTIIVNRTWIRNLRRECIGMSDAMIDELLIGVKVVGQARHDTTPYHCRSCGCDITADRAVLHDNCRYCAIMQNILESED